MLDVLLKVWAIIEGVCHAILRGGPPPTPPVV